MTTRILKKSSKVNRSKKISKNNHKKISKNKSLKRKSKVSKQYNNKSNKLKGGVKSASKHKSKSRKTSKKSNKVSIRYRQKGGTKPFKQKLDELAAFMNTPAQHIPHPIPPALFRDLKEAIDNQTYEDGFSSYIKNCPIPIPQLRKDLAKNIETLQQIYGGSTLAKRQHIIDILNITDSTASAEAARLNIPHINNIAGLRQLFARMLVWHYSTVDKSTPPPKPPLPPP